MNATMPDLKKAFEASESSLQRKAEAAMARRLGKAFLTFVRPLDALGEMLASEPYDVFRLGPSAKRIVTFLRDEPGSKLTLPGPAPGPPPARYSCGRV
jgi:hypothetical protein